MTLVTNQILGTLVPISVSAWILPPSELLYYQYIFIMPAIFYAGVRLACADFRVSWRREAITLGTILLGVPVCWALAMRWAGFVPVWFVVVVGIVSSVFLLAAATRTFVAVYVAVRRKWPVALGIFSFLVGIAGPIGGLWLNAAMPFPVDFQGRTVYAMALLNGLVLLLPNFRNPVLYRLVWLAQCALFPFTLYFFLVFLPFLPLSLPAMIIVGAGFLVLTPTALFLVHGQRIIDGYRNELRDGSRLVPAILATVALAIMPGLLIAQAVVHRVVLRRRWIAFTALTYEWLIGLPEARTVSVGVFSICAILKPD